MKYVIDENNDNVKLTYYNVNIEGLDVTPKNDVPGLSIKAKKVVLVDPILQDSFINKRINKKIDKIIKFMIRILNDEGTTDEDTGMVLDEINRLKGIIINKYREFMKESEYKSILTKLILIEEEFKKSYNQKMYSTYLDDNIYEEEITSFRGR